MSTLPQWLEHDRIDRLDTNQVDVFLTALISLCDDHGFVLAANGVAITEMPGSFTPPTITIKVQKAMKLALVQEESAGQSAEIAQQVVAQINARTGMRRA